MVADLFWCCVCCTEILILGVHSNRGNGMYIFEHGNGVFEDNDIRENDSVRRKAVSLLTMKKLPWIVAWFPPLKYLLHNFKYHLDIEIPA